MSGFDPIFRSSTVVGSWSPQSAATFSAVSASATLSTELTAALHVERNSHTNSITQYISNGKNGSMCISQSSVVRSHETTSLFFFYSYFTRQCRDDIWHYFDLWGSVGTKRALGRGLSIFKLYINK